VSGAGETARADLIPARLDARATGLLLVAVATGVAATGAAGHVGALTLGGIVVVVVCAGLLLPEVTLAFFVVVGGMKGGGWLAGLPVDATVLAACGVVAGMAARVARRGVPSLPPAIALAVTLGAVILLGALWSPASEAGLVKAVRFEFLTLLAFVAPLIVVTTSADFSRLMAGLTGFAGLIALTAVSTADPNKPLVVPGGNEIELALYVSIGVVAALYLATRHRLGARMAVLAIACALAVTVAEAGSRGVLVGLAAAGSYAAARALSSRSGRRVVMLTCAVTAIVLALGLEPGGLAIERYQTGLLADNSAQVLGQRQYLLDTGATLAVDHPLGLGTAGYPAVTGGLVYPHNVELELAAENGLPALAIFLALLGAAWLARRRAPRGLRNESIAVGALTIVALVDAQVSHGLNDSRPLWLSLGLGFAVGRMVVRSRPSLDRTFMPGSLPVGRPPLLHRMATHRATEPPAPRRLRPPVVFVTSGPKPYHPRHYHLLARGIHDAGIPVVSLAQPDGEAHRPGPVPVRYLPSRRGRFARMLSGPATIARALRLHPALLVVTSLDLLPWAVVGRLLTGVPTIYDSNEDYAAYMLIKEWLPRRARRGLARVVGRLEPAFARRLDAVTVADNGTQSRFAAAGTTVLVVNNFPRLEDFPRASDVPPDEPAYDITYHGTVPSYHVRHIVAVARRLVAGGLRARWCLAVRESSTEHHAALERELEAAGVRDLFTLRQNVPFTEIPALLEDTRVGFIPLPDEEKFHHNVPRKLFEFMAIGRPVVCSDLPPIRRLVGDEGCCVLVEPEDDGAYAAALVELLRDRRQAADMGERGRLAVERRLNAGRELERYVALCRSVSEEPERAWAT